ncbi:MAG: hypothetical protein MZV65_35460 [Chromatiales bacterium]|nr:hypothetical protein [Chromatiales bacterium]
MFPTLTQASHGLSSVSHMLIWKVVGSKKDTEKALDWFKKVGSITGEGGWANGRMIGAVGKPGYFNQNSDALIAQYHISEIYFTGEGIKKDVIQAYHYAKNVSEKSQGTSVFFCCEWSKERGLWLSPKMISDNLKKIEQSLTPQQRKEADDLYVSWKP